MGTTMIAGIKCLEIEIKKLNYHFLLEQNKEEKEFILLKIESIRKSILCLQLVENKINPFTQGGF